VDIEQEFLKNQKEKIEISLLLNKVFPKRFVKKWLERYFQIKLMNQYTEKELKTIAKQLHNWEIVPQERESYELAEVTLGGVDTKEFSSKTMESLKVPKLYFAGEVMDITGHLGGHNLQWAWSSGFAAGQFA
jgi:hypothetical protein